MKMTRILEELQELENPTAVCSRTAFTPAKTCKTSAWKLGTEIFNASFATGKVHFTLRIREIPTRLLQHTSQLG